MAAPRPQPSGSFGGGNVGSGARQRNPSDVRWWSGAGASPPPVPSTKQMLVDVIQCQPGGSLTEILRTPASELEVRVASCSP